MVESGGLNELLSNPFVLVALTYFLARRDKRAEQQDGASVTLAALAASIEERFKTVFNRLDGLDRSKASHDNAITDLAGKVGALIIRLDMWLGQHPRNSPSSFPSHLTEPEPVHG